MRLSLTTACRAAPLRFGVSLLLAITAATAWAKTEIPQAAQPQLAAGGDGRVWLVYGKLDIPPATGNVAAHAHAAAPAAEPPAKNAPPTRTGDVFVAVSSDGGRSFGAPLKIAHVPQLMLGMRRGPRIAAHGDRLTVTVVGNELIAFHSENGGKTWSDPVRVNDVPTSAREGLHDLAIAPDGTLFVTWLDLRNGKTELWGASSKDSGRTWSTNEQIYRSPDKSICECCHPSALFDARGNLAVMWRNSIEGARDLWMITRASGAKTFGAARKVGSGTWKLNACPMDGGRIIALGDGKFASVWQRGGEVFLAPLEGPEMRLGSGKQPVAITCGGETTIFWQQGDDLVRLRNPGQGTPEKFAANARFASVVDVPGDRGAVLAYEQGAAKDKQPGFIVDRL